MRKSIVLIAVIVMFFAGVFAQHEGHQQKKTDMKNENHEKIMEIHKKHAEEMKKIEIKKERLELDLKEELMKEKTDWKAVERIYAKIGEVKTEMWKHKTAQMIEVMKLLPPEQRTKHMQTGNMKNMQQKHDMKCDKMKNDGCGK